MSFFNRQPNPNAQQNLWTVKLVDGEVIGSVNGSSPPAVWNGNFKGKVEHKPTLVTRSFVVEITSFSYHQSTTHSFAENLTLTGRGTFGSNGFVGTLDGDYSSTETFGSATGPKKVCHGTAMPFTFTRQP